MDGARMLVLCSLALLLSAGCQRPGPLNPVGGKVHYRGVPLSNGVVVFTPDAARGESGPIALGTIRADGSYVLNTNDAAGVSAGWYRVSVAAFASAPQLAGPTTFPPPAPLLPEKYRDPELSLLRCQVKANQANTIDLNLD